MCKKSSTEKQTNNFRPLRQKEMNKRGCVYCLDMTVVKLRGRGGRKLCCTHPKCPYRILDRFKTYEDFIKKTKWPLIIGTGKERW